jgi:LacI family transcriptional regulator
VHLVRWLLSLRLPAAILACNDLQAWRAAEVCRTAGFHLPEEISLLGAGNEEMYCESALPPISSIALPSKRIGFEAAALLERMMNGERPPKQPVLLPPVGFVSRQSTDVLAIRDPDVSKALGFIRENAGEPIRVDDVLGTVPVSRRALERKVYAATRRTILDHINHAHLERAKTLLTGTDLSVRAVAAQSGFQSGERMAVLFRQRLRTTPSNYRKKFNIS